MVGFHDGVAADGQAGRSWARCTAAKGIANPRTTVARGGQLSTDYRQRSLLSFSCPQINAIAADIVGTFGSNGGVPDVQAGISIIAINPDPFIRVAGFQSPVVVACDRQGGCAATCRVHKNTYGRFDGVFVFQNNRQRNRLIAGSRRINGRVKVVSQRITISTARDGRIVQRQRVAILIIVYVVVFRIRCGCQLAVLARRPVAAGLHIRAAYHQFRWLSLCQGHCWQQ